VTKDDDEAATPQASGTVADVKIPCPHCGADLDIDYHELSTWSRTEKTYLPGEIRCSENERHDVSAARVELDWPTHLTEEDRAWLRKNGRLHL
jgi:hypothetical protein